ncbi:hypothetical protein CBR_g4627 [Chara braunii]|uniref:Glycosyl-hydrolase family 116 N-terminal domain-containing protein n=1 Tax=Chara braunii TaxID=69332 RepID=A0A388KIF6_CHABU|nr:hypothetical protein CBR_g4627 [Chara braunii]|eukprot:GBG69798.1 hypothetical protein CBR_g4627 [Chara braunii]
MWEEVRQNGFFFKSKDEQKSPSGEGCAIGAAVAAFTVVPPGMSREMVFSLAWDAPIVKFCEGSSYYRRYTKFYGVNGKAAAKLAHDAICRI